MVTMDDADSDLIPARSRAPALILGVAVAAAVVGGGAWWLTRGGAAPGLASPTPATVTDPTSAPGQPLAIEPAPDAPPIPVADAETRLRQAIARASSAPELVQWLAQESILQRIAASVTMVAAGATPRPMLGFIEIPGRFEVDEEIEKRPAAPGERVEFTERAFISPKAYARYDRVAAVVTSVDPGAAGLAYAQLRGSFGAVFAQIAKPEERFDDVVRAAIQRLLAAPVPDTRVEVVPRGATFLYADPALEALRPAEKQLIRMGPQNQRALQVWMRRFAAAAGIDVR